ncbi:MAG: type II toxin-antitoxin system RatA family toxin [bacterium]|nr:type II toxin-antitoxin system RatA family toxin [bacterium]
MPKHSQVRQLPYTRESIFDLIADVESYPDFLPWCQRAEIHERSQTHILATLCVGQGPLKETFRSRVKLKSPEHIQVSYEDGPFKYLHNTWDFKEISPGLTEVHFFVDFKFKSMMLEIAMGAFFTKATQAMMQAFEDRAAYLNQRQRAG